MARSSVHKIHTHNTVSAAKTSLPKYLTLPEQETHSDSQDGRKKARWCNRWHTDLASNINDDWRGYSNAITESWWLGLSSSAKSYSRGHVKRKSTNNCWTLNREFMLSQDAYKLRKIIPQGVACQTGLHQVTSHKLRVEWNDLRLHEFYSWVIDAMKHNNQTFVFHKLSYLLIKQLIDEAKFRWIFLKIFHIGYTEHFCMRCKITWIRCAPFPNRVCLIIQQDQTKRSESIGL